MMTVGEIMTRDLLTLPPDASVRDAMRLLVGRHVSGAPVVAGDRLVGVVSAGDLLDLAASLPGVPTDRPEQAELDEWEELPQWTEGDEPPAAFFTDMWSDAGAEVDERFREIESPEWDPLTEHTVAEVMTRSVQVLPPSATVVDAARRMRRAGVHRVLVMNGDRLVGIVSALDIARALGDGRLAVHRLRLDADRRFDDRGWA